MGLAVEFSKMRALLSVHKDLGPIHIITKEKKEEEMEQKKRMRRKSRSRKRKKII